MASSLHYGDSFTAFRGALQQQPLDKPFLLRLICEVGFLPPGTPEGVPVHPDHEMAWVTDQSLAGGGVLLHDAYEWIDQMVAAFGLPQQVYALGSSQASDKQQLHHLTEDSVLMMLRFGERLAGEVVAVRFEPGQFVAMMTLGTFLMMPGLDLSVNMITLFAFIVVLGMVVDDAKCESCHSNLSLHGSNRHDANGYCQTCHNPSLTDEAVRPEDAGDPESVDFRYMIHKIHRGAELENGYVAYGCRSSKHDYSDVHYVGDLRNCDACHVDDSQSLPLPAGTRAVTTPRDMWTPMLPETASCLSCHDGESAANHALSNTSENGEACATCHGTGKTWSVEAVHAR